MGSGNGLMQTSCVSKFAHADLGEGGGVPGPEMSHHHYFCKKNRDGGGSGRDFLCQKEKMDLKN